MPGQKSRPPALKQVKTFIRCINSSFRISRARQILRVREFETDPKPMPFAKHSSVPPVVFPRGYLHQMGLFRLRFFLESTSYCSHFLGIRHLTPPGKADASHCDHGDRAVRYSHVVGVAVGEVWKSSLFPGLTAGRGDGTFCRKVRALG